MSLLVLILFILLIFPFQVHAKKPPLVQTSWNRSDGIRVGGDVYFLSRYSLYLSGKVIIPMFFVTDTKVFFQDLSLYRLSGSREAGGGSTLQRVWSPDDSALSCKKTDLQSCRLGRAGDKVYLSWTGVWNSEKKKSLHPVLEFDTRSGRSRFFPDDDEVVDSELPEGVTLEYKPPDLVKASDLWVTAGLLPLDAWSLPSPLDYSSREPDFLKKVLVEKMGDRDFRRAALKELDGLGDRGLMEDVLREMSAERNKRTSQVYDETAYGEYYEQWSVLIEMGETLRGAGVSPGGDREDVFTAAFDNDAARLARLLDAGADPNSTDEEGRNLLMYAIFGGAPDSLRLLFENEADPDLESNTGYTAWLYAALSPLRNLYLELWGK